MSSLSQPSGDRNAMLDRIREALRVPAPLKHPAERSAGGEPTTAHFREWLPPVGASAVDRFELFSKQCDLLKTELILCADLPSAAKNLVQLAQANQWNSLALHHGNLPTVLSAHFPSDFKHHFIQDGYDKIALETVDAGLTSCELLVAQTGSVCVTSKDSGGRVLSVLPPHHIVIATRAQIVTDLSEAYIALATKYRKDYPSMVSFISGPSRTGDIERILVLGAHGPKRLTILLLD